MKKSELKQIIKEEIQKEIKVEKPLNKKDIISFFFDKSPNPDIFILEILTNYNSLDNLLKSHHYNSVNDWLETDFGFDNENSIKEYTKYINYYYKVFKPKEILVETFSYNGLSIDLNNLNYKYLEIIYMGSEEYVILYSNFQI